MKGRRKFSHLVLILVAINLVSMLTGCATSEKIPIPTAQKDVYIYDEDNIIDDDVEEQLNQMLVELEEKTEAEFVVISVESLLDQSVEDYANNVFNTLGIGKKDQDNGVLLLFSRSDEKVRLEIGRGLEGCLNDSKCGRILDTYFVPYRENDEYTEATQMTVTAVLTVVSEEYDVTLSGLDSTSIQIEEPDELTGMEIIIIIIGLIILEWITGHIFGDGFGDGIVFLFISSGGGSSSSSRGGFGGGFSGGGGASR